MEKLKYPLTKEQSEYMAMRQRQNRARGLTKAEEWAKNHLESKTRLKWTEQARWGYRIFDFWNHLMGCAVEIDGPEHKKVVDAYRDEYNFRRSGIVVLRVKNFNEMDMKNAITHIFELNTWAERRSKMIVLGSKQMLSKMEFKDGNSIRDAFLENKQMTRQEMALVGLGDMPLFAGLKK